MNIHQVKGLVAGGILGFAGLLFAEEVTLTTYYPSPRGVYDEVQLNRLTGTDIKVYSEKMSFYNNDPASQVPYMVVEPSSPQTPELGSEITVRNKMKIYAQIGDATSKTQVGELTTYPFVGSDPKNAIFRIMAPMLLGDTEQIALPDGARWPDLTIRRPAQSLTGKRGPHMFIGMGSNADWGTVGQAGNTIWPRGFPAPVGLQIRDKGSVPDQYGNTYGFGLYVEDDSPKGTGAAIYATTNSKNDLAAAIHALVPYNSFVNSGPSVPKLASAIPILAEQDNDRGMVALFWGGKGIEVRGFPIGSQPSSDINWMDAPESPGAAAGGGRGGNVYANDYYLSQESLWVSQLPKTYTVVTTSLPILNTTFANCLPGHVALGGGIRLTNVTTPSQSYPNVGGATPTANSSPVTNGQIARGWTCQSNGNFSACYVVCAERPANP